MSSDIAESDEAQKPKVYVKASEATLAEVAVLEVMGATAKSIAEQTGLSKAQVIRLRQRPEYIVARDQARLQIQDAAIQQVKTEVSRMAKEVVRVIQEELARNSLEAAKMALKVMGFDNQAEKPQDTNITVVLPGSNATHSIEGDYQHVEPQSE